MTNVRASALKLKKTLVLPMQQTPTLQLFVSHLFPLSFASSRQTQLMRLLSEFSKWAEQLTDLRKTASATKRKTLQLLFSQKQRHLLSFILSFVTFSQCLQATSSMQVSPLRQQLPLITMSILRTSTRFSVKAQKSV